jgi:hypothetical protein
MAVGSNLKDPDWLGATFGVLKERAAVRGVPDAPAGAGGVGEVEG